MGWLPGAQELRNEGYLDEQREWLAVETLPGYAPELNPVENLWGNIKGQELANRCSADLREAATAVNEGWNGSSNPANSCFPSLTTPDYSFDHSVTVLCEIP